MSFGQNVRTTLWTFTFRARRPGENAARFKARTTAPDMAALRPEEQLKPAHDYFRTFLKAYSRRWGERLEYFRTWEFTKQGVIHYHAVVRLMPRVNRGTLNLWARRTWARITGEPKNADRVRWAIHTGHKAGKGLASAVGYAAKYAVKDYSVTRLGEQLQKGVRRISKSNGLLYPAAGDLDKFVTHDGEIHDEREYRRAYGRAYYHVFGKDNGNMLNAGGRLAVEDYIARKSIKDRTLMIATAHYRESQTWTDPPEMFIIVVQHPRTLLLRPAGVY